MTKGLARSISRGPALSAQPQRKRISLTDAAMTVDGVTGVGWGTVVIGDFPEGNVLILGAVASLSFTGPTSASLGDTWNGDYGIGSTPASDATISGADVDIIPSTAVGPAVAEASPTTRGALAAPVTLDNTDGSLEINLSLLVDDADISADGLAFTVNGSVEIVYVMLGDD